MRNNLILLHSHMKKHFHDKAHLWKKVAIISFLLLQATSFAFNGNGFGWSLPLKEISKNECRKQNWNTLTADCKQPVPVIENANYNAYMNNPTYRLAYSVLWGGTYNDGWDMDKGGHEWVDLVTSEDTPVYAVEDGIVTKAGAQAGYGNVVVIKHTLSNGKPVYSTYGHVHTVLVQAWQAVKEGQQIATVGHEGMAYGDHLHFVINTTATNTYAFRECPDLKRGEIAVANEGLCRDYLTSRTVDPIAWIASQGNTVNTNGILAYNSNNSNNNTTAPTTQRRRRMPMIPVGPRPETPTIVSQAIIEKTTTAAMSTTASTQRSLPKSLPKRTITSSQVSKNEVAFAPVDSKHTATNNGTAMEVNNTSKLGEEFLQKYNVIIMPSFGNSMNVGQTSSLIITIADKATGKPFVGMLPKEITIIPTQALMTLSPQVVRITNSEGKAIILINATKAGSTDMVISYNMKSIAKISVKIN